jgi:hypothetical protein
MPDNTRHRQAGQGRPPILTPDDDYVAAHVQDSIVIGLPGREPERFVPAKVYLDACDQWEAWRRTCALINAVVSEPLLSEEVAQDAILRIRALLSRAGLTRADGIVMAEVLEQVRQGRLRVPPA